MMYNILYVYIKMIATGKLINISITIQLCCGCVWARVHMCMCGNNKLSLCNTILLTTAFSAVH